MPGIYNNLMKRVKNKTLKRILNSDGAHFRFGLAANNCLVMNKGITNIEINNFFENEENQDIKNNNMGVYSVDSITK